jgi:hypothetical protein
MRKLLVLVALLVTSASPALAASASKDGTPASLKPALPGAASAVRADFEYNTGGAIDFVPEMGGSSTGWAEWAIAFVTNNSGSDLSLMELGWPCSGPTSGPYGWLVWTNQPSPPGPADSAEYFGPFTPADPDPASLPPTTYTYIDVSAFGIPWPDGTTICIGYDNTGMEGMTAYNGVETYGWYGGIWDADSAYGRTAILQVKANISGGTPTWQSTWGKVKALYR